MPHFNKVPIIDVHKDNFVDLWPTIVLAIKSSTFLAIDTELSGLGNRKLLNARCIEDRYKAIAEVAKTRSIISFGLSCFKLKPRVVKCEGNSPIRWEYLVQTFNLTTLCVEDYIVEPGALTFLLDHGFDFNKQYSMGIPYYRGNDKNEDDSTKLSLRSLFSELVLSGRSIALHNALVDLVFLYHSLYAYLPATLSTFVGNLEEIFHGGMYDTKYISEYHERSSASYLEYIFRKYQRQNAQCADEGTAHVSIQFLDYPLECPFIEHRPLGIDTTGIRTVLQSEVCLTYANHGWCSKGSNCPLSHNVDCVLDMEFGINRKKKKRRRVRRKEKKGRKRVKTNEKSEIGEEFEGVDASVNYESNSDDEGNIDDETAEVVNGKIGSLTQTDDNIDDSDGLLPTSRELKISKANPECVGEIPNALNDGNVVTDVGSTGQQQLHSEIKRSNSEPSVADINCPSTSKEKMSLASINTNQSATRLERKSSGHRAGCDAFMTGFALASLIVKYGSFPSLGQSSSPADLKMEQVANKVYLSSRDVPLLIKKSAFTTLSKNHKEKQAILEKIRSN